MSSDPKPGLDEATGRDVKDYLTERLCDQQERAGAIPSAAQVEPLVMEAVVNVARRRDEDAAHPVKAPTAAPRDREAGEWYGEPGHSPRVPGPVAGERVSLRQRVIGTAEIAKSGPAARLVRGTVPVDPNIAKIRSLPADQAHTAKIVTILARSGDPAWLARLQKVAMSNMTPREQAAAYEQIAADAMRLYGDPRKKKDPRIIVAGPPNGGR